MTGRSRQSIPGASEVQEKREAVSARFPADRYFEELPSPVDERTRAIIDHRRTSSVVRRRGWLVRRVLVVADLVGLGLAFLATEAIFVPIPRFDRLNLTAEVAVFLAILPVWILVAKLYRLYDRDEERTDHTTSDDIVGVFHLVTVGSWLLLAAAWITGLAQPTFPKLLTFWGLAILLIVMARAAARAVCRTRLTYIQNTVIVGAGEVGQVVAKKLLQHPEYGINLVGFVDSAPKKRRVGVEGIPVLGTPDDLLDIVRVFDVERVVIAFSGESHENTLDLVRSLSDLWVQVDIVPRLFEIVGPSVSVHTVGGVPLLGLPPFRLTRSSRILKRAMDLALSVVGLVLLAPALALIGAMIKVDSSGPIFFRQTRIGSGNKPFQIIKFRTMVWDADVHKSELAHLNRHAGDDGDARMFKVADDPRVTRAGRILRRYLLDELPQLVNVLKGEMSLVGPRPLILEEDQHVGGWARKRLDLQPGMTGLWQVLGRSDIPFEEMVKLDYLYVTTWSLWNDIRLLLRTIPLVSGGAGRSY